MLAGRPVAVWRAGKVYVVRNAAVRLADVGTPGALELLALVHAAGKEAAGGADGAAALET